MEIELKAKISKSVKESISVKEKLLSECVEQIKECADILIETARNNKKFLFCGNGGSAADSQHLSAELVIRFRSNVNRKPFFALALTVDPSIATAGGNDIGFENVFARQVEAYGDENDVLVAISTSGNSENVIRAVKMAKEKNMKVVGLLGGSGGKLANLCDAKVIVPSNITARIQEAHILIGHIWCELIEEALFPELFNI